MVTTRRNPDSLVKLCLVAVQKLLASAAMKRTWNSNKNDLSNVVQSHIPHNLRQKLQEQVVQDWRVYDTGRLREPPASLTGLLELSVQDPVWTLSRRQLGMAATALSAMTHLRVLTLQYCAHDRLLAVVGANCPFIQVVDVRGSRDVTDEGVWSLVTLDPGGAFLSLESHSQKQKVSEKFRNCWGAAVKSLTSRLVTVLTEATLQAGERRRRLPLTNLRCTRVTPVGLSLLTQALPPTTQIVRNAQGCLATQT
ncbi:hypothetical protein C7M84_012971 [Penaeus vannamei]|uniref:Uncharacterized protein n=1 Tax=Penaeus vannamei TaxID=6689 RepID=A0A423SXG5_PENVA|nr:hypothetical protein C7M84_012971 [Penaeus vannamei]